MKRIFILALGPLAITAMGVAVSHRQGGADTLSNSGATTSRQAREGRLNRLPLKLPLADPRIVIRKSARELTLYAGGEAARVYRVGLGFDPEGDKTRQGDGRTPEGSFYVCVKNPDSKYHLSLGLSYPNKEHAARGLRGGLITRAQHDQIMNALEAKARPPWDTPLGGEVFIHGRGSKSDWTFGCVALDDGDMEELFAAIPKGTPVVIEP
ncbi:MAG TPA: L,D-transpeptidase [Blastocatellia bacterium]|jgi:murein L,D-transpeptidase YafK|nr:L,D-transpeptidase [Blastocatellia bacterium]